MGYCGIVVHMEPQENPEIGRGTKTHHIKLRVDEATFSALQERARRNERSVSAEVRVAINVWLRARMGTAT